MNIFKNNKDYKVGLYLRLSKEDGDKVESESISNQRNILTRFCNENELTIFKEYVDDGISGLKFDRNGFNQMKKDIEEKNINMVIVKDLSRLGRDYSEVGKYIERYFPEHNVRFIAIYDEIDTIIETDDMLPLRAVMNDLYCKDASRKFRAMIYNKKKDGMYISPEAPYGYKKDPDKKGHLIVFEEEKEIVKRIFSMYLSGFGTYQIAKKLNSDKVPPPSANRKNVTSITNEWYPETIRNILKKEVYIGDTVLGKTKKLNYKSKKVVYLPKEEWIITRNTHEAIINRKDFQIVQNMLNKNKTIKNNKHEYLLRGILRCKECGCAMTILTKNDKYKDKVTMRRYAVCSTGIKEFGVKKCLRKYINYDLFEKRIVDEINNIMNIYVNNIDLKKMQEKHQKYIFKKVENYTKRIEKIQKDIEQINSKIDKAYLDKLDGIIENNDYERISDILIKKREENLNILKELKKEVDNIKIEEDTSIQNKEIKKKIKTMLKNEKLNLEEIFTLIDKIYIDKEYNIEIIFNFKELNLVNECI